MNKIDINTLKQANAEAGRCFFSDSTMSFFKSRPDATAYQTEDGAWAAFVDSVKPPHAPREYSVRFMDMSSGCVVVNRAMHYGSLRTARKAAEMAIRAYDGAVESGAIVWPDTNRMAWFVSYGLPASIYCHVHDMHGGEEFHVFSVAGGPFTEADAYEHMMLHMWEDYPSDL